jgi:hypothetical protein
MTLEEPLKRKKTRATNGIRNKEGHHTTTTIEETT